MATPTTVPRQHATVIGTVTDQFQALFEDSAQSMYIFLDDRNKSCNARFAKLLGYDTPSQWAAVTTSFPQAFVHPDSQATLVEAYRRAMEDGVAARIPVTWQRRDGKPVRTQVILAPLDVDEHRVAVHFIDPASA